MKYVEGQVFKTLFRIWCGDIGGLEAGALFTITECMSLDVERPYLVRFSNGYECEFKCSEIERLKDDSFEKPMDVKDLKAFLNLFDDDYKVFSDDDCYERPIQGHEIVVRHDKKQINL